MACFNNITTNAGGIAYLPSTNVTVGTESVDIALGFRRIQPVGYFTVRHSAQAIIDYYGADWNEDDAYLTGFLTKRAVEILGEPCR